MLSELFGWAGSILLIGALTKEDMFDFRTIALISNLCFITQALMINSWSLIFIGVVTMIIHLYKLKKMLK